VSCSAGVPPPRGRRTRDARHDASDSPSADAIECGLFCQERVREPALFANTAREQCGLNTHPWERRSGTDQASPVHGDTAPILADGSPVRPPPRFLPLQAGLVAGQISPDCSRILREESGLAVRLAATVTRSPFFGCVQVVTCAIDSRGCPGHDAAEDRMPTAAGTIGVLSSGVREGECRRWLCLSK
jgi:hypothetical protein